MLFDDEELQRIAEALEKANGEIKELIAALAPTGVETG